MIALAIDLGVTGAWCVVGPNGVEELGDLPVASGRIMPGPLASIIVDHGVHAVVVERVHSMPTGSRANFSMGMHLGLVLGVAGAFERPVHEVAPPTWKRHHRLGKDKDAARELAARLVPSMADRLTRVKDHNRAEALLLGLAFMEGVR